MQHYGEMLALLVAMSAAVRWEKASSVASRVAGANSNRLAEEDRFDPISGNAVLNGIPVTVVPA